MPFDLTSEQEAFIEERRAEIADAEQKLAAMTRLLDRVQGFEEASELLAEDLSPAAIFDRAKARWTALQGDLSAIVGGMPTF
jgi:hypothetical protein